MHKNFSTNFDSLIAFRKIDIPVLWLSLHELHKSIEVNNERWNGIKFFVLFLFYFSWFK